MTNAILYLILGMCVAVVLSACIGIYLAARAERKRPMSKGHPEIHGW